MNLTLPQLAAALAFFYLLPTTASALTWTGGGSSADNGLAWSDATNFGGTAFTNGVNVDFGAVTGNPEVTDLDGDRSLQNLRFTNVDTDAVTINDNTLTLTGTGVGSGNGSSLHNMGTRAVTINSNINNSVNQAWTLDGNTTTINGIVSGGLPNVFGNGNLVLGGDNTYTGDLIWRGNGTITLGHPNGLGATSTTFLDGVGSKLDLNGQQNVPEQINLWAGGSINTIRNGSATEAILDGNIVTRNTLAFFTLEAAAGPLTVNGDVTMAAAGVDQMRISGASTVTLNGDNSGFLPEASTGIFILNTSGQATTLKVGSATATGDPTKTIRVGNAAGAPTLDVNGFTVPNPILLAEQGARILNSAATPGSVSGDVTLPNASRSSTLQSSGGSTLSIDGALVGDTLQVVINAGTGAVELNGASAFTGNNGASTFGSDINMQGATGVLRAGDAAAFGDSANLVRVGSAAGNPFVDLNGQTIPNTIWLSENGSGVRNDSATTAELTGTLYLSAGRFARLAAGAGDLEISGEMKDYDLDAATSDILNVLVTAASGTAVTLSGDNSFVATDTWGIWLQGTTGILRAGSNTAFGDSTNTIRIGTATGNPTLDVNGFSFANEVALSENGCVMTNSSANNSTLSGTLALAGTGRNNYFTSPGGGDIILTGTVSGDAALLVNMGSGALLFNGDASGATGVIQASIGTIGGTGTYGGQINLTNNSASIAPGVSIGTFTVNAQVDTGTGTLEIEIDGSGAGTSDLLTVNGTLDVIGTTLNVTELAPADDAAYIFASYTTLSGTFASENIPSGYEVDYNYNSASQIALVPSSGLSEPEIQQVASEFQDNFSFSGTTASFSFSGLSGGTYEIERTFDLGADPIIWTNVFGPTAGTGTTLTPSDIPAEPQAFYRLLIN